MTLLSAKQWNLNQPMVPTPTPCLLLLLLLLLVTFTAVCHLRSSSGVLALRTIVHCTHPTSIPPRTSPEADEFSRP